MEKKPSFEEAEKIAQDILKRYSILFESFAKEIESHAKNGYQIALVSALTVGAEGKQVCAGLTTGTKFGMIASLAVMDHAIHSNISKNNKNTDIPKGSYFHYGPNGHA